LALYFGKRASKLRFQRDRILGVDFPRKKILIPAVLIMIVLFLAFVMVKDLGATLILSALFLAMFYIVTRAGGWVLLALAIVEAHLTEEMGAAGMIVYLVLLFAIAGQGLWIAAWNRTPERMLLAAGLSIFLIAQWFVIFAGTTGVLPLTGVVVPYLSWGKTGM